MYERLTDLSCDLIYKLLNSPNSNNLFNLIINISPYNNTYQIHNNSISIIINSDNKNKVELTQKELIYNNQHYKISGNKLFGQLLKENHIDQVIINMFNNILFSQKKNKIKLSKRLNKIYDKYNQLYKKVIKFYEQQDKKTTAIYQIISNKLQLAQQYNKMEYLDDKYINKHLDIANYADKSLILVAINKRKELYKLFKEY